MPLTAIQRISYLPDEGTLRCLSSCKGFTKDHYYPFVKRSETSVFPVTRKGPTGMESIETTSTDAAFWVWNEFDEAVVFCRIPFPDWAGEWRFILELSEHFDIPAVPDVSEVFHEQYTTAKRTLEAFNETLSVSRLSN
jgi:hypothetical protein